MMNLHIKKRDVLPVLVMATLSVSGCTAPEASVSAAADREAINREMPLVAEYESKRNELKRVIGMMARAGAIEIDSFKQVKEPMDIEYVYYEASLISLARGEMRAFRNFVQLAEQELERAKTALLEYMESAQNHPPSGSRQGDSGVVPREPSSMSWSESRF